MPYRLNNERRQWAIVELLQVCTELMVREDEDALQRMREVLYVLESKKKRQGTWQWQPDLPGQQEEDR